MWVNEEDHMRIVSMEKGDNVKQIIERFAKATSTIQQCLKNEGYDFMHSEHLGWILTCPSNLGTGLRAGAMVKVSPVIFIFSKTNCLRFHCFPAEKTFAI